MIKRPYKAGQTLWIVWTQLNAADQQEFVVKPLVVVSCRMDVDPDYHRTNWVTMVRFMPKFEHARPEEEIVIDMLGMFTHKTRRKAQRIKNDWDAARVVIEKTQVDSVYNTNQEIY